VAKEKSYVGPVTGLVSPLVKYKWGEEQQKAFNEIKQKVSKETLLAFPNFKKNLMFIQMHPTSSWEQ
jgi:hypothetical protein